MSGKICKGVICLYSSQTFIFSGVKMKIIKTKRLILRMWQLDDLDDYYAYAKNPNVGSMAGWKPSSSKDESLTQIKSFIGNDEVWAIVLKENGKIIDHLKIYPDENRGKFSERNSAKLINYALSEDYWGKGYMTEAVKVAVKYAFDEMNIELLTAFHFPHNISSKRVLEKCGFEYEGIIEQGYKNYDGQIFDSICHSILKPDYYRL